MKNQPKQLGPYQIIRPLGRGGMGAVYEGIHIETGEPAAVKVLLETIDEDPDVRVRFETEIGALKMLRHPHIVRLNGFGEEDGSLYYVMELVNGQSLYQELKRKRSFTWQDVAKIGFEMCLALKHGHDRGIIHRDIKPANVMLDNSGSLKLSDYGIAHFFGGSRVTSSNSVIGTIEFMSPEQATASPITPRSDLYSLGAVLYTLLCRRPPLLSKTLAEIIRKHKSEQPESVTRFRHDVPMVLVNVIHDLLEIKPENRPANAYLVVKQIETLLVNEFGSTDSVIVLPSNDEMVFSRENDDRETKTLLKKLSGQSVEDIHDASDDSAFLLQIEDRLPPTKNMTQEQEPSVPSIDDTDQSRNVELNEPQTPLLHIATDARERHVMTGSEHMDSTIGNYAKRHSVSHFVRVEEDELGQYTKEDKNNNPLISVQVIVLSSCLVILGLWAWYMLQPKSADALFHSIERKLPENPSTASASALFSVENDVNKFLELYHKDPRAHVVKSYSNEIQLAHQERLLERRLNSLSGNHQLLPVERAYLEAISLSSIDPEEAIKNLEAVIDLYGGMLVEDSDLSNRNGICVELAKRRLNKLHKDLDRIGELQLEQLTMLMAKADSFDETDRVKANRMRKGLIRLYGDKQWAQELITQAKEKLQAN